MFEFLFNQPIETWQQADWVLARGWPTLWLGLLGLALLGLIIMSMWRMPLGGGKRFLIGCLQLFAAAVALLMLWLPSLRTESLEPGENTVAYIVDASGSMHQQDKGRSLSRIASTVAAIDKNDLLNNPLFENSLYTVTDRLQSLESLDDLPEPSSRSAIAEGVESLSKAVEQRALAAVVLLSDGADNTGVPDTRWWQTIKAAGIPIHTVGVGAKTYEADLELMDVSMQQVSAADSLVRATVVIQHHGVDSARLRVKAGDRLLYADDLTFDPEQLQSAHQIEFNSGDEGITELDFSVSSASVEDNRLNNTQRRILDVGGAKRRILYVEGEPRWEFKFIRRAMKGYSNIELVSLLRTSANKYYRQGVSSADELANGFPKTREALFSYDAVIIGSFEAALLSLEQQANLRDFVSIRGGSLLMLAGKSGLSNGGWGRTLLAQALPVSLNSRVRNDDFNRGRISFSLTQQGQRTDWLKLEGDNITNWKQLPALADIHVTGEPRAGSVVLMNAEYKNKQHPLLVWQRYGQGQSFVMATSGTWRWQMRLPAADQTHEQFWQGLLTKMVSQTLQQVSIEQIGESYRDTPSLPLAVTVRDDEYAPVTHGKLTVDVIAPDNSITPIELIADINNPGRFVGAVDAPMEGPYGMKVQVPPKGESQAPGSARRAWWMASKNTAEYFGATRNESFLKRVAAETGGQYFELADIDQLGKALSLHNSALTRTNLLPLWNMPFFFLCLFGAKLLEWLLRLRWQRL